MGTVWGQFLFSGQCYYTQSRFQVEAAGPIFLEIATGLPPRDWYLCLLGKQFSLSILNTISADLRFEGNHLVPEFDYCFTLNKLPWFPITRFGLNFDNIYKWLKLFPINEVICI